MEVILHLEVAKDHLRDHGRAKMPSVLSKEKAYSRLGRLWQTGGAVEAHRGSTHLPSFNHDSSDVSLRIFFLTAVDKIFRDMASHPTAVGMVKFIISENFLISNFCESRSA
jgi:hypothetical protein